MEWARGFLEKKVYLVLAALLLYSTSAAWAATGTLAVNVNQSLNVEVYNVTKASIANPEIADIVVVSNQELVLIGKKPGDTTLRIWTANGSRYTYEVRVGNMNNAGATEIKGLLGYPGIRVSIVGSTVMLEGSVRDQNEKLRAEKVAAAYAEKVVNLLEITNPKQVRLEVRVLEISSTKANQVGIQLGNTITGSDGSVSVGSPGIFLLGQGVTNSGGHSWGGLGSYLDIGATVSALIQNGDAELLSSPSIVTMSGEKANILIGGELPIPVAYENGKFSVEWKEYGIKLDIEPLVDSKDLIHSTVKAEVSNIDNTSSYAVSIPNTGYHIPALRTRRAESVVEMSSGATMAIGGLISSEEGRQITKIPLLGDLPILGQFFRHTQNSKERREIVILVTPYLTTEGETPKMSAAMKALNDKAAKEPENAGAESAKAKKENQETASDFQTRIQAIIQEENQRGSGKTVPLVAVSELIDETPETGKQSTSKEAAAAVPEKNDYTAKQAASPSVTAKASATKEAMIAKEVVTAKPESSKAKVVNAGSASDFQTRIQSIMQEENEREAVQAAAQSSSAKAIADKKAVATEKAAKAPETVKQPTVKAAVNAPAVPQKDDRTVKQAASPSDTAKASATKEAMIAKEVVAAKSESGKTAKAANAEAENDFQMRIQSIMQEENEREAAQAAAQSSAAKAIADKKAAAAEKAAKAPAEVAKPTAKEAAKTPAAVQEKTPVAAEETEPAEEPVKKNAGWEVK